MKKQRFALGARYSILKIEIQKLKFYIDLNSLILIKVKLFFYGKIRPQGKF